MTKPFPEPSAEEVAKVQMLIQALNTTLMINGQQLQLKDSTSIGTAVAVFMATTGLFAGDPEAWLESTYQTALQALPKLQAQAAQVEARGQTIQ